MGRFETIQVPYHVLNPSAGVMKREAASQHVDDPRKPPMAVRQPLALARSVVR